MNILEAKGAISPFAIYSYLVLIGDNAVTQRVAPFEREVCVHSDAE